MNIKCLAEKVLILADDIENIESFLLGTKKFFDSVSTVSVYYEHSFNSPNSYNELDTLYKHFK